MVLTAGLLLPLVSETLVAQAPAADTNYIVQWGRYEFDTRSREQPCTRVDCGWNATVHLLRDGRIYAQGNGWFQPPPPPVGLRYIDAAIGTTAGMGILSDGTAVGWGFFWPVGLWLPPVAPPLPAGLRYERVCLPEHGLLLRSDGAVVAWGINGSGETNVPPTPPGTSVVDIRATSGRSGMLLSDGSAVLWGRNDYNQNVIPALPAGVTIADLALSADGEFTLLLRSDGLVEAFGRNDQGQLVLPTLPPGVTYTNVAGGSKWGIASRSDDVLVTWGASWANPPAIPPGLHCVELDAGQAHAVARLSDGSLLSWGHNDFFEHYVPYREPLGTPMRERYVDVAPTYSFTLLLKSDGTVLDFGATNGTVSFPPLPPGERYVQVRAGTHHALARRSDGEVFAWGIGLAGQTLVPALPPGLRYVDVRVSNGHSVLLRSDGQVLAFGTNTLGECNVPPLPPGMTYIAIECMPTWTLLLRSDGTLFYFGKPSTGMQNVPSPPPGRTFVDIAAAQNFAVAIASDGSATVWGGYGGLLVPALPAGVVYIDGAGMQWNLALRRSDGELVVLGPQPPVLLPDAPPLEPGTSYVQVAGFGESLAGRVGPTSTYVAIGNGCAGSLPATRLVPRDTPRIDGTLRVQLLDLPIDVAMVAMSLQPLSPPLSLAAFGMPGCDWHVPLDAVALVAGQNQTAAFELVIPNVPSLVGTTFYQQALVLDPQAGNAFGAVVSDVAEGVVGHW